MSAAPALARRLEELGAVLGAHAGGIELVELNGGVARVRYTGMCTGCPLRPVTTASTVRPALLALDGVDELEVEGSRISAEAEARIAAAFARCSPGVSRRARGAHPRAPGSPRRRPRQR